MIGKEILGYRIDEKIGSGGFGTVYKVSKNNVSGTYVRALKHITLPTKKQYLSVLNSMGGDYAKADDYFEGALKDIVSEIQILNALSEGGVSNIVKYYENDILVSESPKTYDIFILMEFLTPYTDYLENNNVTVKDVIALGKDILNALQACHSRNIIHRDIKDENIFIGEGGVYKLGDFGVAKALKDRDRAETVKGTPNFIAPEVYLGKGTYDNTVDLYSLGIVLYRLLNHQRNPFMPVYPTPYNTDDEDIAFTERMSGKEPELPLRAKNKLGEVIVKSLLKPDDRYKTAQDFLTALIEVEKEMSDEELNEVVCEVIAKEGITKKDITLDRKDKSLQETMGFDYSANQTVEEKVENRHLFDTFAADYLKPVKEDNPAKEIVVETKPVVEQPKRVDKKEQTIYNAKIVVPEKKQEPEIKEKNMKPSSNKAKAKRIISFVAPAVLLFCYIAFYAILIPVIYGKSISFFTWLFADVNNILDLVKDVNSVFTNLYAIILLVVLQYVLLGALCTSFYFLAKSLHNPAVVQNDNVKYNNKTAGIELTGILYVVKGKNWADEQTIDNLNYAINSLKYTKPFGYSKDEQLVQAEMDICRLIDQIKEAVDNAGDEQADAIKESISKLKQKSAIREQISKK